MQHLKNLKNILKGSNNFKGSFKWDNFIATSLYMFYLYVLSKRRKNENQDEWTNEIDTRTKNNNK
jgi:hypothetical protein